MKTNPCILTPNLSSISENPQARPFSFKRLFLCSLVWGGILVVSAAIAIAQAAPAQPAQRTDGLIETDVVQALDSSNSLKNEQITAATIQGEVTLTGNVSNESSRELAEILASRVPGVTHVQNNLTVTTASTTQTAQPMPQAQVTQPEVQPQPEEVAQNEQPQQPVPATQPQTAVANDPPPPHVQMPPSDPAAAEQGIATQTVTPAPTQPQRPTYAPSAPADQTQSQSQTPSPYPNVAPPQQPNYQSNARPQIPQMNQQPQPNPAYGAHAPEPPYDPTPLTILKGTSLDLRTNQFLDDKRAKEGTTFDMTVIREVNVAGKLAIPRGAIVHGVVVESKSSGQLGGAPSLALKLVSIDLGPNNYPLTSDLFKVRGPNKAGHTAGNVVGGALFGSLIGAAIGRGPGAAIGAIAGAGTGTALSAAGPNPRAWIPAEALVSFHIEEPVTIVPVTPQEAFRLAQTVLPSNGPTLYHRGPAYYANYNPGYPYYPAPMPFYHPYYMMGGYYYWR